MSRSGLATPLRSVLGARTAGALTKGLDLETVGDLLRHYPRRYAERGEHTDLAALRVGDQVTVMAQVQRVKLRPMRQRRGSLLDVSVGDGRRSLTLTFFNQAWRERDLQVGRWGLFAGKVTEFRGVRQLNGPSYQLLAEPGTDSAEEQLEEFAGALIPVYPAAGGLPTWTIARCVKVVLDVLEPPPDPLPEALRTTYGLAGVDTALRDIHRPPSRAALAAARQRLAWDEAFALQVALAQRRAAAARRPAVPRPPRPGGVADAFDAALPFPLTAGQRAVGAVLATELAAAHPMHRLLQGEVGSGKTVCAVRAMLQVVDGGGQAALLAPTEVLAAQHARSIRALLGPLGRAGELDGADEATRVALLTGSLGAGSRRTALAEAADGTAGIVVGTHALISEGVKFAALGFVVVDEQHRFGVEQRDALRAKSGGAPPHLLVMTATPIPRTVAMTVFGDLETSALTELPAGRSPITTSVVPVAEKPAWLDRAWQRVCEEVAAGHQAYVVCPRIGDQSAPGEDTEDLGERAGDRGEGTGDAGEHTGDARGGTDGPADGAGAPGSPAGPPGADDARRPPLAVLDVAPMLRTGPLADVRVGVLHGRLPTDEKDAVMRDFTAGRLDVLVATTVVEVGVDVPNASVMVVLDADRFGVSQLHQLRGRVGRGSAPGLCLLVTDAPAGTAARQRLDAVASTVDGFRLAELDLEQRREGDVLGVAQSGRSSQLRLLSLRRDAEVILAARTEATALVAADPELTGHPALAETVAALVGEERAGYLEKA